MELSILHAIQSVANPILDYFFIGLTYLEEPIVAAALLTLVYWLWDKETGEYMAFTLLASLNFNGLIKNICNFPRPIGQPGVRSLCVETATGASFPSGHAQTAATLYSSFAWRVRRAGVTAAALFLALLVGFSRLYLGVHWPKDVLVGLVLGVFSSLGGYLLYSNVNEQGREWVSIFFAVVFLPLVLLWHDADFAKAYGLLVGFSVAVPLEHRYVKFDTKVRKPRNVLIVRELVGLAVLAVLKFGLGALLPPQLPFAALEYGAVAFAVFYLCPLLFVKLKL